MERMSVASSSKKNGGTVGSLRRLLQKQTQAPAEVEEKCEMCTRLIEHEHPHLVNLEHRTLLCVCRPCALLFESPGAAGGKFRRVPDRRIRAKDFRLSEVDWESLRIPVRMAFFFQNSSLGKVVTFYPSPAGATESLLELEAWRSLSEANPILETLVPDVEALLVYAPRGGGFECFIVPISDCYELTGVVRQRWRGFDGGQDAWADIEAFFARLRAASREMPR